MIVDKHLEKEEYIALHPMDNSATIEFQVKDLSQFMENIERKLEFVALDEV